MKTLLLLSAMILGLTLLACSQKLPVPTSEARGVLVVPTLVKNKTQYRFPYHYQLLYQPESEAHIKIVPQLAYEFVIIDDFIPGKYEITALKILSTPGEGLPSIGTEIREFSTPYPLRIRPGEIKILGFMVVVESKYTNPSSVEQTVQTIDFRELEDAERDQIATAIMALPNAELWTLDSPPKSPKEDSGTDQFKLLSGLDCYRAGLQYEKGDGVARDLQKALKWYHMSAGKNYLPGKNRFKELCGRYPDACEQVQ